MKRALVLSGGGNKGAFETGVIYQLITERRLDFDVFSGTSVGALNAAFLAQGSDWEEQAANIEILKTKWLNISGNHDIYYFSPLNIVKLLFGGALYQPFGLKRFIESLISPERLAQGKTLLIPTVSLDDGALYIADTRKPEDRLQLNHFLLASASMPIYFPPVKIRGKYWVDGGLRDITPLNAVLGEFPTEIIVITTYPVNEKLEPVFPKFTKTNHILAIIHRVIDILTAEIASSDLRMAKKIKAMDQRLWRSGRLLVVSPERPLEEHCLDFSPKLLSKYFELGVRTAQNL